MSKRLKFLDNFKDVFGNYTTLHSAKRYFTGLLSDISYKNCGMMVKYMEGTGEQVLKQFISSASPWDYGKLNCKRMQYMLENVADNEGMNGTLIFDDTDIKKDKCSVGVARQYSGTLDKVGNCQVVVSCQYTDDRYI